jgi:hypothetical protein
VIVPVNTSAVFTLTQVINTLPLPSYKTIYSLNPPPVAGIVTEHKIALELVFAAGVVKETLPDVTVLVPNDGPRYTSSEHDVPSGRSVLTTTLAT